MIKFLGRENQNNIWTFGRGEVAKALQRNCPHYYLDSPSGGSFAMFIGSCPSVCFCLQICSNLKVSTRKEKVNRNNYEADQSR